MRTSEIRINNGRGTSSTLKKVILANLLAGKSNTEIAVKIAEISRKPKDVMKKKLLGYIGTVKKEAVKIASLLKEGETDKALEYCKKYFEVDPDYDEIKIEDYLFSNEGDPLPEEIGSEIYNHYNK